MKNSEEVNEIFGALAKAQGEMQHAVKNKKNPFFKSHYADIAAIIDACRKPLADNALSINQSPRQVNGQWLMITKMGHVSGQWIEAEMPIICEKNTAQAYGSGMSYARRYALAALLGIAAEDEDDGEGAMPKNGDKPEAPKKPLLISEEEFKNLNRWLSDNDLLKENFLSFMKEKYGLHRLEEMPKEMYGKAVKSAFDAYTKKKEKEEKNER